MSNWIRCDERMPDVGQVLVWHPDECAMSIGSWDGAHWYDIEGTHMTGITHWQPLPEPPND